MGTMIPLGLVFGWIFAVLGILTLSICYAGVLAESDFDSDFAKWGFVIALIALIAGVILITKYWIGGA